MKIYLKWYQIVILFLSLGNSRKPHLFQGNDSNLMDPSVPEFNGDAA